MIISTLYLTQFVPFLCGGQPGTNGLPGTHGMPESPGAPGGDGRDGVKGHLGSPGKTRPRDHLVLKERKERKEKLGFRVPPAKRESEGTKARVELLSCLPT